VKPQKPPISDHRLVLADTSLFCRFEETLTWMGLLRLLDHFDKRLRIVTDVNRELSGHERGGFPGLRMMRKAPMKGEFLRGPAEPLPTNLSVKVGQIAPMLPSAEDSGSPKKNFGEVATALLAREIGVVAVIDDTDGRAFADRQNVVTYTTREVAAEMAALGVLADDDAARLWAEVFEYKRERRYFDAAVTEARAKLGRDADAVPS
jgi:hypothetical protein